MLQIRKFQLEDLGFNSSRGKSKENILRGLVIHIQDIHQKTLTSALVFQEICKEIQRNTRKYRDVQGNAEKYKDIQRYPWKCRDIQGHTIKDTGRTMTMQVSLSWVRLSLSA